MKATKDNNTRKENLIPVSKFAETYYNRRGFPVSVSYLYRLIRRNKQQGEAIPFEYKEIGKTIWIKVSSN